MDNQRQNMLVEKMARFRKPMMKLPRVNPNIMTDRMESPNYSTMPVMGNTLPVDRGQEMRTMPIMNDVGNVNPLLPTRKRNYKPSPLLKLWGAGNLF